MSHNRPLTMDMLQEQLQKLCYSSCKMSIHKYIDLENRSIQNNINTINDKHIVTTIFGIPIVENNKVPPGMYIITNSEGDILDIGCFYNGKENHYRDLSG